MQGPLRDPHGAELINGSLSHEKTAPTNSATSSGELTPLNRYHHASPQITAGDGNRFQVWCLADKQRWTEHVPNGARPGEHHRCPSYQGDEQHRYSSTIRYKLIVHKAVRKPHACTFDRCQSAFGSKCECECGGRNHGVAHELQCPCEFCGQKRSDLDRLYDRLEASEAVDYRRKRAERGKP